MSDKPVLVGKDLQPRDGMQITKFDLAEILNMRDFLSGLIKMTIQPEHFSLVLAAMALLTVEAVEGKEEQAKENLNNTLEIFKKLEEIKDAQLREKLARAHIEGTPS
jgi:hypothetical protein